MNEKLKKYFENFKNLYGKNNKETNLKILKLGIEIGKESNNNEKFFIEEIEKEINQSNKHQQDIYDFQKQIIKIIKPFIDKDIKNNSIEFDRSGWKRFEGNFLEDTQKNLGIKISRIDFEGSENDVRIYLDFIEEKGFINSIFEYVPFDIYINNPSGGDFFTWDLNDRYDFRFTRLESNYVNSYQLENYKNKMKEMLDGEWGKQYVFNILSGN
jgi:hypothetical protein